MTAKSLRESSGNGTAGKTTRGAKHRELTQALEGMIARMSPGDRLPTQEELMRRFQVSDTTVLRSLDELRRAGRIIRRQGSGTFVSDGARTESEARPPRTHSMVAVLARPSTSPFFSDMIQAVEANLCNLDLAPVLIMDADVDRRMQRARDYWLRGDIAGAIHIGSVQLDGSEDFPVVLVGETDRNSEYCQVSLDNTGAGRRVGEYLWSLGHRSVAVITIKDAGADGPAPRQGVDRFRVAGLRSLWEQQGGGWHTEWQIAHPFLLHPGDDRAISVMRSYLEPLFRTAAAPHPTAIFAAHDEMATVAIRALEEMGMRVPDDVSVVGFNDSGNLAAFFRPSLTTVRTPSPALGTLAVHQLHELLRYPDRKPRSIRLPPDLIIRESTAPPPSASSV